ncbi:hypothetical protein [Burkholderia glumae]|uniref:Core-binding (CB) domain-containing protein n=1 Tax=Burkholderia glumae TaxID=337 RepID=A0AAP9Y4T8_BURGL|nr:hypothetical protein [Burkholderia glumae]MCM2483110.1 hypothetical protein [Burkholderia glumae]MCM2506426.1 hypothetical protein [Burkholderia glumae]MCM2538097.1 hypothetical protein [Burkholderia glumae]QPQ93317.1 hypothetical protein I6H06_13690 [Burkholderia glumae]QQM91480.1 hypothetical protein I6G78_04060 [Burkholderia glumae]
MSERQQEAQAAQAGPMLSQVVEMWLTERTLQNAPRTVTAKRLHLEDFRRRVAPGDVRINALVKSVLVGFKAALLADGQTGKTVDNKLLTPHDLFKYALANGHYTASHENPVAGLFVLSKTERIKQADPYQPFTLDDLRAIFKPLAFTAWADAPDLWFATSGGPVHGYADQRGHGDEGRRRQANGGRRALHQHPGEQDRGGHPQRAGVRFTRPAGFPALRRRGASGRPGTALPSPPLDQRGVCQAVE